MENHVLKPTPFELGALLTRAWNIWRLQWTRVVALILRSWLVGAAVLVVPVLAYALGLRAAAAPLFVAGFVAFFLVQVRYSIALYQLIAGADAGLTVAEALKRSTGRLPGYLLYSLIAVLVVIGAMLPFMIPYFIWLPTMMLAPWLFVLEDRKGLDVLVQARRLVKGDGLMVFTYFLVVSLMVFVAVTILNMLGKVSDSVPSRILFSLVTVVAQLIFIVPFQSAFHYALYESLRAKKGMTPPDAPNARTWFIVALVAGAVVIPLTIVGLVSLSRTYPSVMHDSAPSIPGQTF